MSVNKTAAAIGYCDQCEKLSYVDRKSARHVARKHRDHKQAYRCPHSMFWHVGELPEPIRKGYVTRDEFFGAIE
jgi:hypothetical protein